MRLALLLMFVLLLLLAAFGARFYAAAHPAQTRAAMEALRVWPTLTPTPTPRPTATPTPVPSPTAIPSPTATLPPARTEPRLVPNGAPGAAIGLQRPARPSAPVEWYDPTSGIDVRLRRIDTRPVPGGRDERGNRAQYLRI